MKNSEIVSKITNSLRLNTKDGHISRRYILKVLKDISKNLISKKLLDRTLGLESNLYTTIPCLEFEKIEVISCPIIEFRLCRTLMKSKCKLPDPTFSRLGVAITDIVSLDGLYDFTLVSPSQYRVNKKRQHSLKGQVFIYLADDGHLYIPDEEILTVSLSYLTLSPEEAVECSECLEKDKCKSGWDEEFKMSDKLDDAVFKEALQIISSTYRAIPEDQNQNGIENA